MGPAIVPLPNDIGNAAAGLGDWARRLDWGEIGPWGMEPEGWDRGATYSVMAVLGAATHDFAGTRESRGPGTAPVTTQAAKAAQRPHLWHAWADARLDAAAGITAGYWSSLLKRRAQILGR